MNIQKLAKEVSTPLDVAYKYYQIISIINDLHLAKGELQLLAFTAHNGNISDPLLRELYCKQYKTSLATINNTVHRLKKKNLLIKDEKGIHVNPTLNQLKFNEPIGIVLALTHSSPPQEQSEAPTETVLAPNNSALNVRKYG